MMQVTEIRFHFPKSLRKEGKLRAYCSVILDGHLVIRHIRVVHGTKGLFLAMPYRKQTDHCPQCSEANHLEANFCNQCGMELPPSQVSEDVPLYSDVVFPNTGQFRSYLTNVVLNAYHKEVKKREHNGQGNFSDDPINHSSGSTGKTNGTDRRENFVPGG